MSTSLASAVLAVCELDEASELEVMRAALDISGDGSFYWTGMGVVPIVQVSRAVNGRDLRGTQAACSKKASE